MEAISKSIATIHRYPEYIHQFDRLKSFVNWPKTARIDPHLLSDAGFFYWGVNQEIACFSCGVNICRVWHLRDNPWKIHVLASMASEHCDFIETQQGSTYIQLIRRDYDGQIACIESKRKKNEIQCTKQTARRKLNFDHCSDIHPPADNSLRKKGRLH